MKKYFKIISISFLCTIAVAVIMYFFQTNANNALEEELMDKILLSIPEKFDKETKSRELIIREHDKSFQYDLASIKYIMQTADCGEIFKKIRNNDFEATVFLVNKNGIVKDGSKKEYIGRNFSEIFTLSKQEQDLLLKEKGNVNTPVRKIGEDTLAKFYATSFNDDRLIMYAILKGVYADIYSFSDEDAHMDGFYGLIDERLYITIIDNQTKKISYLKTGDVDFSGHHISAINLDESVTQKPSSGHSEVMGYGYTYRTIPYHSEVFGSVTVLVFYTDWGGIPIGTMTILLITVFLISFLIQLYCHFIDSEHGKLSLRVSGLRKISKKGHTFDVEKARTLMPFSLISILFLTLIGFYLNSLYLVGCQFWTTNLNISQISDKLRSLEKKYQDSVAAQTEGISSFLNVTSSVLENKQESLLRCTDKSRQRIIQNNKGEERVVEICNPWLLGLCEAQKAYDLSIFDNQGNLVLTSGTLRNLSFSRENPTYKPLFDVIDGVCQSTYLMDNEFYITATAFNLIRDGKHIDAMLVSRFKNQMLHVNSVRSSLVNTFNSFSRLNHTLYMMSSSEEDHKVIFKSNELIFDSKKLPEEAYKHGYVGFHSFNGNRYMVTTVHALGNKDDYYIMSFLAQDDVYQGRAMNTLSTFAITLLVILILLAVMLINGPEESQKLRSLAEAEAQERNEMTISQLGKLHMLSQKELLPSQRILAALKKIWIVFLLIITVLFINGMLSAPLESFTGYMMSFIWQRGINIFSISSMLLIILSFSFGMFILTRLMSILTDALNTNAATICLLIVSLLRYAGYITVCFVTLYMFGVDTTGVLASLGAFSVMVGLGAKNLITDVLAGISIIMEKDYKVGDIVNIDGFCGKVTEIGIRTTKIEDIDSNVKIFYNSGINGVINMTSHLSAVKLNIKIDSKHKYQDIEVLVDDFFSRISRKYSQIKGECSFLGIQESAPDYNIFLIAIPCNEIDRVPLRRALLRDLNEICEEYQIIKL